MSNKAINKKFVISLIIPCVIALVAIIFAAVFGFNKGMDFKGGIQVSVMAQNVKFESNEEYNEFKAEFDEVLKNNDLSASVYIKELDAETYNNVLVAKIDYSNDDADILVQKLKDDYISVFYSDRDISEIDNLNLVEVEVFNGYVTSWQLVSSVLASLILALAVCLYMFFRMGLHSSFMGVVFAVLNNLIMFAVIMVTRVKTNAYVTGLIPLITILTLIVTFLFERRAKRLLKTTQGYEKKSNLELATDTIKYNSKRKQVYCYTAFVLTLGFMICNAGSEVFYLGLALLLGLAVVVYNYVLIMPNIFALTYIRKQNKYRINKKVNQNVDNLTEAEVLKETDLDNLVSN